MSEFRITDLSSEQRRAAFEYAKREIGLPDWPDEKLTPMAMFLIAAIAEQCVIAVQKQAVARFEQSETSAPDESEIQSAFHPALPCS